MPDTVHFDRFELQPAERRLLEDGSPIKLGSRAFDLLVALVEQNGLVVKDELMKRVWHGVIVEENNLSVQVAALRKVLGNDAIATVIGHGYRFTLPVSCPGETPISRTEEMPVSLAAKRPTDAAPHGSDGLELPEKTSVVVLPLTCQPDDSALSDMVDGITDGLITGLGRFRSLFVVSPGGAFGHKWREVDARTVGHQLGVRYVVEGNVRRADQRMRVAAQLVDALDGNQIWSEQYDRKLQDAFALQDELSSAILAAIVPWIELSEEMRVRRVRPDDLPAHELALRAWGGARTGLAHSSRTERDEAVVLARRALEIDPWSATALKAIVDAESWNMYFGTASERERATIDCAAAAERALAIDGTDHLVYRARGWFRFASCDLDGAIADFRRSLELNPNDCITLSRLGLCEAFAGDPAGGTRKCLQALRLGPRFPSLFSLYDCLAWTHFASKSYGEALRLARQSLGDMDFEGTRLCVVLSLVGLNDLPGAAAELEELRRRAPAFVATRLGGHWPDTDPEIRGRRIGFLNAAEKFRRAMPAGPSERR